MSVDLSGLREHLDAIADEGALRFPVGDRVYTVPEPGPRRALRCVALWATTRIKDDVEARNRAWAEALGDDTLEEVALGSDVAAQLEADDVPASVVSQITMLALMSWALGPAAAQRFVEASGGQDGGRPGEPSPTPRPGRKTTGTASGSGSRTRSRASGRAGTASPAA